MEDILQQPDITTFGDVSLTPTEPIILPNGIQLYVVNSGDQDVNKLEIAFRGGVFEEDCALQATAMASMLVHGSEMYSSRDIAEKFDFYGSWFGVRYLDNHTVVTLHSLNHCFENTLPVLRDIVYHPTFPEKEFEVLKNQLRSAYKTAREKVKYIASVEMNRMYFGSGHPLAREVKDEDIDQLSIDDLRRFHTRYYHPNNCTIIMSGKIGENEIKLVSDTFGNDSDEIPCDENVVVEEKPDSSRFYLVDKPNSVQSAVAMSIRAVPRNHVDYIPLRVLVTALGGYFGSRLMRNVREEKGYTYGINASLIGRSCGAYISISTECATAYTESLIVEVKKELANLRDELIPDPELNTVKSYMLSDLVKTLDTPFSLASYVDSMLFYGVYPEYFNNQVDVIRRITAEEVRDLARRYLLEGNLYTVVAGDKSKLKIK